MNTMTKAYIERQPAVVIQPDAMYTCATCRHRAPVASATRSNVQPFINHPTIICGGCNRAITLAEEM